MQQRLACFQKITSTSYVLNWYLGPQQGDAPCGKSSWQLVENYKGHKLWISDFPVPRGEVII